MGQIDATFLNKADSISAIGLLIASACGIALLFSGALDGAMLKAACAAMIAGLVIAFLARDAAARTRTQRESVTMAKRMRELEEANRLLKLTETTAKVGHWRVDLSSNEVYWSDGCFAIHGLDADQPPALSDAINFYHEDDREVVRDAIEMSRETGEPFSFRARLLRADGDVAHTMSTSLVEFDEDGSASALFGVFCDRTDEEEMQAELRQARNNADATANARSSFLAKMSHEIRTPMNGVLGFAELLSTSPLSKEQQRHVDLILDSGKALQTLLNDILDLTKVEEGKLELRDDHCDIAHLATKTARLSMPIAQEKGIDLTCEVDANVPHFVKLDSLRLRQILGNLLSNAVRFTDHGTVALKITKTDHCIVFTVRDTGIGIAPDMLISVFDPFCQDNLRMHSQRGGTGLGLPISRQLCELMGGDLVLSSTQGEGSTFTLSLPLVIAPAPQAAIPHADEIMANPCNGCHCRILLAEDFDINQELICDMGRRLGLTFEVAEDGEEAVAAVLEAREQMKPFSLVLMDLQMPQMDGLEAAQTIRDAGFSPEDLPIIALTANAFADDIAACLKSGMQEHVAKPLELAQLRSVMHKHLRGFQTGPGSAQACAGTAAAPSPALEAGPRQDCRRF